MGIDISLEVNGKPVSASVEPNTLLVTFLREDLGLTGTHVGCDTSQCGACNVHVDGLPIKACTLLAAQAEKKAAKKPAAKKKAAAKKKPAAKKSAKKKTAKKTATKKTAAKKAAAKKAPAKKAKAVPSTVAD